MNVHFMCTQFVHCLSGTENVHLTIVYSIKDTIVHDVNYMRKISISYTFHDVPFILYVHFLYISRSNQNCTGLSCTMTKCAINVSLVENPA